MNEKINPIILRDNAVRYLWRFMINNVVICGIFMILRSQVTQSIQSIIFSIILASSTTIFFWF